MFITYLLLLIVTVVGQITAVVFQIWKWNKAVDANDRFDFVHVYKFGQYLYFCVLVSSASFLRFGSYTLWPLRFKITSEAAIRLVFWWKIIQYLSMSRKEQNRLQKYFLNLRIVGRRKMPSSSLNIICNVPSIWIQSAFSF